MPDKADAERAKQDLIRLWQTFRDFRGEEGTWTNLLRRRLKTQLEPGLDEYSDGVDIQSAILEVEAILRTHILKMNGPKVDVAAQEEGERIKDVCEDVRIWFASQVMELDQDGAISDPMSADQVTKGVSFWGKEWHRPTEPDPLEEEENEKPEAYGKRSGDHRDAHFKENKTKTFGVRHIPVGALMFSPLDNPTVFIEEVDVPYMEWSKLKNKAGKYASLEKAGEVLFLGDARQTDTAETANKKLRVLRYAYREPDTGVWKMCEYLTEGGNLETGDKYDEYDCPMGSPYEVVASGDEMRNETDPHLRYRPMMYELYVNVKDQNYWRTRLGAITNRALSDERLFVRLSGLHPEIANRLQGMGYHVEGEGAEQAWVWKGERISPGEMHVYPDLAPIPNEIPEALLIELQNIDRAIENGRTSRFLSGAVSVEEITQGTASAIERQTQQTTIPFSASVKKQAAFWKRVLMGMRKAILEWDEGAPSKAQKKYYVLTSGEEPIMKGKVEAGTVIFADADKMRRKFETLVYIRNMTDEEQERKTAFAVYKWERNLIDLEQLFDEMGFEDPKRQKRLVNRERQRRDYRGRYTSLEAMAQDQLLSALSGINMQAFQAQAMGQQPGAVPGEGAPPDGQGDVQPPNNNQRVPAPPVATPAGTSSATAAQQT